VSGGVLAVVLVGALLHACWNLLIKSRADTRLATGGLYAAAGLIAGIALPLVGLPARASWPYLAASMVAEIIYGVLLAATYEVGDLSHAYPLMRGTAPLLVAVGSVVLVGEPLSRATVIGVLIVCGGILSLIIDARGEHRSSTATRLALLNACAIATYTTIDGMGVRVSGNAAAYSLSLFLLVGMPWAVFTARQLRRTGASLRRIAPIMLIGGACSLGSYGLALWAMTQAPVAAVAAVRESSIAFSVLLGALVLHERVTRGRAFATGLILVGVWVVRGAH
jgi:drug/metabolite transporter (DMT)-like permease